MPHSYENIDAHLDENSQAHKLDVKKRSEDTASQLDEILTDLPQDAYTQIFEHMHTIDKEKDYYSEWYNGRVYVVDVTLDGGKHQKLLVIKCRKNTQENEKLIFEYYNHIKMFKFSNKMASPFIWVPKVYGIKNDNDGEMYLIMNFIEGMTLYSYKLSKVLPLLYQELEKEIWTQNAQSLLGSSDQYNDCKTDKDIKLKIERMIAIWKRFPESAFYQAYLADFSLRQMEWTFMEQKQARIFDRLSGDFWLGTLSPNTVEVLQDAMVDYLTQMHQEGLYHNDVTHRNIILWEDGKIYLIDFDKAGPKRQLPVQARLSQNERYQRKYKGIPLHGDYKIIGDLDSLKMNV